MTESARFTPHSVWIVIEGFYSDQSIWGVFSSEEEAKRVVELSHERHDSPPLRNPEEFKIVATAGNPVEVISLRCDRGTDGVIVERTLRRTYWPGIDGDEPSVRGKHCDPDSVEWAQRFRSFSLCVAHAFGTDHEAVRKAYGDHRTQGLNCLDCMGIEWHDG